MRISATEPPNAGEAGTRAAASAGSQAAPETPNGEPSAGRQRGHAGSGIETGQHQRAGRFRRGQHLQGDLGDHAERAVAAGEQLAQVEAGDVLQHAPAGTDDLGPSGHRADAQHVVAHRTPGDAARTGQVGGDDAAEGLRLAGGA